MQKIERKAEHIAVREKGEEARFYFGQIKDVLELIKANQVPDGRFSDDEISLWEELKHTLSEIK